MASFDAGKFDVMDMMTRKPWYAVVSTLFKQTTQDKVAVIIYQDVPQTVMAAAYWFMSPNTSAFVVLFNIQLPILRLIFAVLAYPGVRRLAQPWLRDELRKATIDGNEVKASYVMKHIIGGRVEALVKAQGGHIDGDTVHLFLLRGSQIATGGSLRH